MASKKQSSVQRSTSGTWTPPRFIQQELEKFQKEEIKALPLDAERMDTSIQNLVVKGYSIRMNQDRRDGSFAAYLTQQDKDGENAGYCLPGRGSTPLKALKQLLYKHFVIFDGGLWDLGNGWGSEDLDD